MRGSNGDGTLGGSAAVGDFGDFGGVVRLTPRAVVHPGSAREVAEAVREAAANGLDVVARGCGHSTDGRSLTGGTALDLRGLASVREVRDGRLVVDAGATWREVLDATLPYGLTPPVLTDYLDLTVGETLVAGGVGGTSHVYGTQAATVLALDVVTRAGEAVTCSPDARPDLFDAVRGGGTDAHGIITRATLPLVRAPESVRSYRVTYPDAARLLDAQRHVTADDLSGQAKPLGVGGWRFELTATVYGGERTPDGLVLADVEEVEELPFLAFADRMRPDVEELVALGEWARPHPWGMVLLPRAHAADVIARTLDETAAVDVGLSGVVLVKAFGGGRVPMLRAPDDPVLFSMLRTASPGCRTPEEMAAANDALLHRARASGGGPYPAP